MLSGFKVAWGYSETNSQFAGMEATVSSVSFSKALWGICFLTFLHCGEDAKKRRAAS